MNIIRIIQWFRTAPNHSKRRGNIRRPRRVGKLHLIAVDRVTQKMRIHTSDTSLDVKLADKACLYNKLPNDMHLHPDGLLNSGRDQNFRRIAHGGIDRRTEGRS